MRELEFSQLAWTLRVASKAAESGDRDIIFSRYECCIDIPNWSNPARSLAVGQPSREPVRNRPARQARRQRYYIGKKITNLKRSNTNSLERMEGFEFSGSMKNLLPTPNTISTSIKETNNHRRSSLVMLSSPARRRRRKTKQTSKFD